MIKHGFQHATITEVVMGCGRILKQTEGLSEVLFEDPLDRSKFTTTADVLSLINMVRSIMELYPRDGIIAEGLDILHKYKPTDNAEKKIVVNVLDALDGQKKVPSRTGRYWAIDPLCGSTPHSRGIHDYIVSLGMINQEKEILYGCVYDPNADTLYFAEKGFGAFKNNSTNITKMKVSDITEIPKQAYVSIEHKLIRDHGLELQPLTKELKRLRTAGTCGLELALTANGNIDAVLKDTQPLYDFCGGLLLVKESGGKVTDYNGEEPEIKLGYEKCTNLVVSNGHIHEKILEYIKGAL
jgi:fructose-1,6-bisphosphatase/inositol monophosphatase family enzyme